jgi:hypothetical protein
MHIKQSTGVWEGLNWFRIGRNEGNASPHILEVG